MKKLLATALTSSLLVPFSAFALEGLGPRVSLSGEITAVSITEEQLFMDEGAEITVVAENGQTVKVIIEDSTNIVTEGRLSRKKARPRDLTVGMHVRVRGWRLGTDSLTASLITVTNVELNPALSGNGVIQSFDGSTVTLVTTDGRTLSFVVEDDTDVHMTYTLKGATALSPVGKQAFFSVSPTATTRLKVLRLTGEPETKAPRPAVRELRNVRYRR